MMKGALVCFLVGSLAGAYAFSEGKSPLVAEAIFVLGFIAGLALLGFDARATQRNPDTRKDATLGRRRA
jgi:hypothetical protein